MAGGVINTQQDAPASPPPTVNYDVDGARAAGVSDADIANFLASKTDYDVDAARKAGIDNAAIIDQLAPPPAPPPPPLPDSSTTGAAARGAERGALPAGGGFAGMVAGAKIGGIGGELIPGLGETGVGEIGGAIVGGLAGAFAGNVAVQKAQDTILDLIPDHVRDAIGQSKTQEEADELAHPYASMIGELFPNLAFMRPGAVVQAAETGGSALARALSSQVGSHAVGAGLGGAQEAASEAYQNGTIDPTKVAIAAGGGAFMNSETSLGRGIHARIEGIIPGGAVHTPEATPEEDSATVMAAGTVDDAIKATSDIVSAPMPDIAPDMESAQTPETTIPPAASPDISADIQPDLPQIWSESTQNGDQDKLVGLFRGLNSGSVEQSDDDTYLYHSTDDAGTPTTLPIKVWNPETDATAPGPEAITPELAKAQTDHYAKLGVDVVYFQNDPNIPFDGAVDPNQPNTIFLSNDPSRNAAQVGAHEVTHVLDDTKLPDGSSLADLLHQQIRDGITAEGQEYAANMFGGDAPDRAKFQVGPEGDAQHAAAIMSHLVNELGADIGGEAPKFPIFALKVADAVEQRYGADVGKGVLQKFIAGIKSAMDTLRKFFDGHLATQGSVASTESQNWVTNLGEIHDTLAQMYAAKYGDHLEIRQTANEAAANRLARGTNVSRETKPEQTPEPPPNTTEPPSGVAPQPVSEAGAPVVTKPEDGVPGASYEAATKAGRVRGARRQTPAGPEDVARFLARQGGIKNTEGHDLVKGRGLQQFIPGVGPLIRPKGMSIDAAGEKLWEAGYFDPMDHGDGVRQSNRPTEADVLELLEKTRRGLGGKATKVYAPADAAADIAEKAGLAADDQNGQVLDKIHKYAKSLGEKLSENDAYHIMSEMGKYGIDVESAVVEHLERVAKQEKDTDHGEPDLHAQAAPEPDLGGKGGPDRAHGQGGEEQGPSAGDENESTQARLATPADSEDAQPDVNEKPAFSPKRERKEGEFATEPGAEDARGKALPQTIIPGAEGDARQVAASREAQGHGKIAPKVAQKAVGGMFEKPEADEPKQGQLLSPRITPAMREQLQRVRDEHKAPTGDLPGIDTARAPEPRRAVSGRPGELPGIINPPEPQGKQRSLVAKVIEGTGEEKQRAVSPGQTYKVGEEKPQIEGAARLVRQDYDRAIKVAMREVQAPAGVHPPFVFMAVEDRATLEGDHALLARLATSPIAEEATTMGQQIAAWRHRDPLSAVTALKSVANARADFAKAKGVDMAKETAKASAQLDVATKQARALTRRKSMADYISSITCPA